MPSVTPIYAALLALVFAVLSLRVILARRRLRVGFGDAGDAVLQRRIRVHANFSEHVPLVILLMMLAELRGASPLALHTIGIVLLLGRLIHAIGLSTVDRDELGRIGGMAGTHGALLGSIGLIAVSYLK